MPFLVANSNSESFEARKWTSGYGKGIGHTCQKSAASAAEVLLAERNENRSEVLVVHNVWNKSSQMLEPNTVVAEAPGIECWSPCIVSRPTPESRRRLRQTSALPFRLCRPLLPLSSEQLPFQPLCQESRASKDCRHPFLPISGELPSRHRDP